MKDSIWRATAVAGILLSALSLFAAVYMGGCPGLIETAAGGTVPMKCHWTMLAATYLGVVLLLLSAGQLLLKGKEARRFAAAAILLVALAALLLTTNAGIGVCAAAGMACRATALPLRGAYVLLLLLSLIQMLRPVPRERPSKMF